MLTLSRKTVLFTHDNEARTIQTDPRHTIPEL
jgi:hypothetical protein